MTLQRLQNSQDEVRRIYAALCRGHLPAEAVTPVQSRALRRYVSTLVKKLLSETSAQYAKGRNKNAKRLQAKLLNGCAARYLAAYIAELKYSRRERKAGKKNLKRSFLDIRLTAEKLRDPKASASAVFKQKEKKTGGLRSLYAADRLGIAKQELFVNAIRPFASFHPSQYALRGGRSAACKNLLTELNRPSNCNTRFIQFDVVDFFGSISREYVEEIIPAPKDVIRNTLFMEGWRISNMGLGDKIPERRGLPQGSAASSFVAEWVMANLIRDLADQIAPLRCPHFYSDNCGGFVPHHVDVAALQRSINNAFKMHRAGPYLLTWDDPGKASFIFLGYYFEPKKDGRPARASLPKGAAEHKRLEFVSELLAAETLDEVMKVHTKGQAFCSAFSLAPEVRALQKRMAILVLGQLRSHLNRIAVANRT